MTRIRRRVARTATAPRSWLERRDEELAIWRRSGLGLRPADWWLYESGRPDLAAEPGHDLYAHLKSDSAVEAAAERLRYLAASGELTAAERAAIAAGTGLRYEWRREALA